MHRLILTVIIWFYLSTFGFAQVRVPGPGGTPASGGGGSSFQASDIASLACWYRMQDATGLTDGDLLYPPIHDSASRALCGDNLDQGSAGRPVYKTGIINGKAIIRFDSVGDKILQWTGISLTAGTIVIVASCADSANGCVFAGGFNPNPFFYGVAGGTTIRSTGGSDVLAGGITTDPVIISLRFTGSTATAYINGVAGTPVSYTGNFNIDRVGLWAQNTIYSFEGDFAEIAIFDANISDSDHTALIAGLKTYYGIP